MSKESKEAVNEEYTLIQGLRIKRWESERWLGVGDRIRVLERWETMNAKFVEFIVLTGEFHGKKAQLIENSPNWDRAIGNSQVDFLEPGDLDGLRARIHLAIDRDLNQVLDGKSNIWSHLRKECPDGAKVTVGERDQEVKNEVEIRNPRAVEPGNIDALRDALHQVVAGMDLSHYAEQGAFGAPDLIFLGESAIQGILIHNRGRVSVPKGTIFVSG